MSPVRHRSNRKIRRTGQHTAPSRAAKVAQKAGKAAPAIAVAGALTVAPQVHKPAPRGRAATVQVIQLDTHLAARTYTIQAGDTLSGIAQRFYGQPVAWPWLYWVNRAEITDPGLISPGQVLDIPANPPGSFTAHRAPAGAPKYRPRHAAAPAAAPSPPPAPARQGGIFSYAALEQLWVAEGGNPADEAFAACIAEHESGGNPGAISPTSDYGLWQEHNDPAALDPVVSVKTAVQMSSDGTDWSAWTTEPDC
jgi:LysM repeat protein